ncbi:MAG: glycosyltransferase family 2 protein, partial [Thermomicrobiales bacterium]|nr:glycosyltransferase family 2 protein [Thermomicrobiales bacterium]
MTEPVALRASVLITNYNYGRFVGDAIDSALAQTWPHVQVVVVDDGSTDESRLLLETYGDKIHTIVKEHGGQASCVNAGIPHLTGDAVIVLDADDMLDPTAIEKTIGFFADPDVVKAHWPMATIDRYGRPTGAVRWQKPASGNYRQQALKVGPASHITPACSGNFWRRSFLEQMLPLPSGDLANAIDSVLFTFSPFFGTFRARHEPLTLYRVHGDNISTRFSAGTRLRLWELRAELLHQWLTDQGEEISIARWRAMNPFVRRLQSVLKAEARIGAHLPKTAAIVLVAGQHYDRQDIAPQRPVHRAPPSLLAPERVEADFREMIDDVREGNIQAIVVQGPATWESTNLATLVRLLRDEHHVVHADDWIVIATIEPQG